MQEQSNFGTLLRRYRLSAGLSQEALATRASLSARTISDLERGIHGTPRTDTLELLTGALSLSAQQRTLLLASARPEVATFVDTPPRSLSPGFPFPPNTLIGREQERSYAVDLLRRSDTRLLTLTGPSGAGKTRLSLQLAQDLAPDFVDGVVYVPLAPTRDVTLVPGVFAQILGIREVTSSSLAEQVHAYLREKHMLLVLDNFEQVLDAASFVADLLATCPRLSILVTSRTRLQVRAEQELQLAPLPLEDAVALFCERVQAVRPGRAYATSEVEAICEQVDRLPLAIELAAMHVKVLSLPELRKRLTHRLALGRAGRCQSRRGGDGGRWRRTLFHAGADSRICPGPAARGRGGGAVPTPARRLLRSPGRDSRRSLWARAGSTQCTICLGTGIAQCSCSAALGRRETRGRTGAAVDRLRTTLACTRSDERGREMARTHACARSPGERAGRAYCATHNTYRETLWLRTNPGTPREGGARCRSLASGSAHR